MSDTARMDRIEDRLLDVEKESSQLRGVLTGIDNQGGLIQRMEKVAAQGHKLANDVASLQLGIDAMNQDVSAFVAEVKARLR